MWQWFLKGGFVMYPLLLSSVLTLGVILERIWSFPALLRQGRALFEDGSLNNQDRERAAARLVRQMQQGLPVLEIVVTAAPMLGLLGTVFGVIRSFRSLDGGAGGVSIANVGRGLSEALICTATGLTVAIVALVAHHFFRQRIDGFVDWCNERLPGEEKQAC